MQEKILKEQKKIFSFKKEPKTQRLKENEFEKR